MPPSLRINHKCNSRQFNDYSHPQVTLLPFPFRFSVNIITIVITKDDSSKHWGQQLLRATAPPAQNIQDLELCHDIQAHNLVSRIWIILGFGVKFWSCGKMGFGVKFWSRGKMGFGVKSRGKISRDLSTKPPSVITNWIHLWSCLAATVILLPIYLDNFYSFCNHQSPQTQHWLLYIAC